MTGRTLLVALAVIMGCGPAEAQVLPPLGATSPLGIGVGSPTAPAGIPMGATELATPGVSPMPPDSSLMGTSPMGTFSVTPPCPSADPSMTAPSVFDGGGTTPTTMATCPTTMSPLSGNPAASFSSPTGMGSAVAGVGRTGIPLGSVELGGGGLSPLPDPTTMFVPQVALAPTTTTTLMPDPTLVTTPAPSPALICPTMSAPTAGAATAPGAC